MEPHHNNMRKEKLQHASTGAAIADDKGDTLNSLLSIHPLLSASKTVNQSEITWYLACGNLNYPGNKVHFESFCCSSWLQYRFMIYNYLSLSLSVYIHKCKFKHDYISKATIWSQYMHFYVHIYRQANIFYNLALCCYLPSLNSKHKHAVEYPKNYLTLMKHGETPA